jgi:hypothetical protein
MIKRDSLSELLDAIHAQSGSRAAFYIRNFFFFQELLDSVFFAIVFISMNT